MAAASDNELTFFMILEAVSVALSASIQYHTSKLFIPAHSLELYLRQTSNLFLQLMLTAGVLLGTFCVLCLSTLTGFNKDFEA